MCCLRALALEPEEPGLNPAARYVLCNSTFLFIWEITNSTYLIAIGPGAK